MFCQKKDWIKLLNYLTRFLFFIDKFNYFFLSIKDGNGTISIEELKLVFKNAKLDENHWKKLIEEADQNGDGEVY